MMGVALVIIGAIFLMKNLGIISGIAWDIFWPLALIVVGISMIFKKR